MKKLLTALFILSFTVLIVADTATGVFDKVELGVLPSLPVKRVSLSATPDVPLITPSLSQMKFGKIVLKGMDFYLAVGRDATGKPTIALDSNGNHDLTDDASSVDSMFLKGGLVDLVTHVQLRPDLEPYYLCVVGGIGFDSVSYFGLTRREGKIFHGLSEYRAAIAETNHDGEYTKDDLLLMLDLNKNGRFESYEFFPGGVVPIDGKFYRVKEVSPRGDKVVFEETDERILVPILGERVELPRLQLVDLDGKPVDLSGGKWRLIYSAFLDGDNYERVIALLKGLSKIDGLHVVAFLAPSSICAECGDRWKGHFQWLKEELEGVQVVLVNFDEAKSLFMKLRPLFSSSREMFMIISPDNVLVYKTPRAVVNVRVGGLLPSTWGIIDVPLSNPVEFVKALIGR